MKKGVIVSQNGLNIRYTGKDEKYIASLLFNAINIGKSYKDIISIILWADTNAEINPEVTNNDLLIKIDNKSVTIHSTTTPIEKFIKDTIDKEAIPFNNIYLTKDNTILFLMRITNKAMDILNKEPTSENRKAINELTNKTKSLIQAVKFEWLDDIKREFGKYKVVKNSIAIREKEYINELKRKENIQVPKNYNKKEQNKKSKLDYIEIYKTLKENVLTTDPKVILDSLGIDVTVKNNKYNFALRAEKTPSVYMEIRGGKWRFRDFGDDNSGDIISIVEQKSGLSFKEALIYCVDIMGIYNPLENINLEKTKERIKELQSKAKENKQSNFKKESKEINSKVTEVLPILDNTKIKEYLESRGIKNVPKGINLIKGIYKNSKDEEKQIWGIGVVNVNGGADIHFTQKIGNLKSRVIGKPGITFIQNAKTENVAIYEAKFDYAAFMQKYDNLLKDTSVIIANSASNFREVIEFIKSNNLGKNSISIFGQNDLAGATFDYNVAKGLEKHTKKLFSIDYKQIAYGLDPNDLLLKNQLDCLDKKEFTSFKLVNSSRLEKRVEKMKNIKKQLENPTSKPKIEDNNPSKGKSV